MRFKIILIFVMILLVIPIFAELQPGRLYINDVFIPFSVEEPKEKIPTIKCIKDQLLGDVDGNKKIESLDSSLVLKYVEGLVDFDNIRCADVNCDNKITQEDSQLILQYVAGLISGFLCKVDASISIATFKDVYKVDEKIELTDPSIVDKPNLNQDEFIIKKDELKKRQEEQKPEIPSFKGYIVQFKEEPVLEKKVKLEKKAVENQKRSASLSKVAIVGPLLSNVHDFFTLQEEDISKKLRAHLEDIEDEHSKTKQKILSKLNKKEFINKITGSVIGVQQDNIEVLGEYKDTFNGVALDVTTEEANELKELNEVKEIYPNYEVKATLMNSVPLINADDVWQLEDSDGNKLTGKDVTIAIIDTGVDYTHPDLGSCFVPKQTETCFEENKKTTQQKIGKKCVDSDGGLNYCTNGHVTIYNLVGDWSEIAFDHCYSENILTEAYCKEDGTVGWININYTCNCEGYLENKPLFSFPHGFCWQENINVNDGACKKVIGGYDFVNNDNDPIDDNGHGTHVAGITAGNGVLKGVAPDAKIIAYKVLNSLGSGNWDGIINAIERAVDPNQDGNFDDHIDIISMSLGGPGFPDDPISQSIDNAVDNGIIAVIAAGNDNWYGRVGSPGTARKAITVGATNNNDLIADFSSRGPTAINTIKPDLTAPGVDICAAQWDDAFEVAGLGPLKETCIDKDHITISGTSMATPHVAGAAALLKQKYPNLNPEEIKSLLKINSIQIKDYAYKGYKGLPSDAMNAFLSDRNRKIYQSEDLYIDLWLFRTCIKVNIPFNVDKLKARIYSFMSDEGRGIELRKDIFGELVKSGFWKKEDEFLTSTFDSIETGDYWVCNGLNPHYVEVFKIRGFAPYYFTAGYLIDSNIFTQGSGRVDILKSINSPILIKPTSINLGLYESNNDVAITENIEIKGLNLDNINLDVSVSLDKNHIVKGFKEIYSEDQDIIITVSPTTLNIGENEIRFNIQSKDANPIKEKVYHGKLILGNSEYSFNIPFTLYVDYSPPVIYDVTPVIWLEKDKYHQEISWKTDDITISYLYFRKKSENLFNRIQSLGYSYNRHFVELNNLDLDIGEYEYYISTTNIAGKTVVDNNNGNYYTFTILPEDKRGTIDPLIEVGRLPLMGYKITKDDKGNDIDFNNNGKKEIIVLDWGWQSDKIHIYEQNEINSFEFTEVTTIDGDSLWVVGDTDNDDLLEIIATIPGGIRSWSVPKIRIYEQQQQNSLVFNNVFERYIEEVNVEGGFDSYIYLSIDDIDNNGKKEIIFEKRNLNKITLWENNKDNSFEEKTNLETDKRQFFYTTTDLDKDNKKEIILVGGFSEATWDIKAFEYNNGAFEPFFIYPGDINYLNIISGDINDNGNEEFITYSSVFDFPDIDSWLRSNTINIFDYIDNKPKLIIAFKSFEAGLSSAGSSSLNVNEGLVIEPDYTYSIKNLKNNFRPLAYQYNDDPKYSNINFATIDIDNDGTDEILLNDKANEVSYTGIYKQLLQSKIVNNEDFELKGTLRFKVQKIKEGGSIDERLVYIENIIIPKKEILKLDKIFNPIVYSIGLPGKYKIIVELVDENNHIIKTKDDELKAEWEFNIK